MTKSTKDEVIIIQSEFANWCLCDDKACQKSLNFDKATQALTDLIDKRVREARMQEIDACLELFINTPTHEFVKNLNFRLKALEVESLEER